jgi:dephospho-CoA kinase
MESILIGITGPIGSGKSTVAGFFQEWGGVVISSDDVARSIIEKDPELREAIRKEFGVTLLPGSISDRKKLAAIVFHHPDKLRALNALVHPPTIDAVFSMSSKFISEGLRIVVVESALIYSAGIENRFDFIVSVLAPLSAIIDRLQKKRGLTKASINRRLENQKPDEARYAKADFIIRNNGNLDELRRNSEFVFHLIKGYLR